MGKNIIHTVYFKKVDNAVDTIKVYYSKHFPINNDEDKHGVLSVVKNNRLLNPIIKAKRKGLEHVPSLFYIFNCCYFVKLSIAKR